MIFYRLACYEQQPKKLRFSCTALTMHPSEASGRKDLNAHKRHLKKVGRNGTGRLEKLSVSVEFLTKSDWMKLILGDSPAGFAKDEDMMFVCDLIEDIEVVTEFNYEHQSEKETKK